MRALLCTAVWLLISVLPVWGETFATFHVKEIANDLTIGYGVLLVDVNADKKTDIVVVDADRVIWFENPTWERHTILEGQTPRDNVCIAAHDIDGDGRLDFALGAQWRPNDTQNSGAIFWLQQQDSPTKPFKLRTIGAEPTVHRMKFADLNGDGRPELIVVPLFGRGTQGPEYGEAGVRILSYPIPADPVKDPWRPEVINEDLHVCHNFLPTDLDDDGLMDLVVVSFEGVSWLQQKPAGTWKRYLIGEGNQTTGATRGASEIKRGRLSNGQEFLATIEPWHGSQVAIYPKPAPEPNGEPVRKTLWPRVVIDEMLRWGHAVWCADLDGDEDDELIIGVRDPWEKAMPFGLRVYDPQNTTATGWLRQLVDNRGVAIEDLAVADLNGDGLNDIVAVGRATRNVRIYWNIPTK